MKGKLQLLAMLFTSAFGFSQNGIQSNSAPANAEQGSTITASFNYTADAAGTCQMQLFKTDSSGNIDYSAGTDVYFEGPITAAATSTLKSETFTIPANLPLSSSLPPGVVYKWFFKIEVPVGTPFYSANPTTTIVAPGTLSTKSFNKNGLKVFYNAKTKNLVFYDVEKSAMSIYDVRGSSVMGLNTISPNNSIDVSSLSNGLYFLKNNNGTVYKFVVQ
ncbi:T9SS type A sorting domain-containing protein [Flavobacterium ovatum]|uniref:T9SS type A sorting domain-containing protein n=1 Tax=Flavobacterium ovatum TaxID=1928857 RepID=UPI00344F7431